MHAVAFTTLLIRASAAGLEVLGVFLLGNFPTQGCSHRVVALQAVLSAIDAGTYSLYLHKKSVADWISHRLMMINHSCGSGCCLKIIIVKGLHLAYPGGRARVHAFLIREVRKTHLRKHVVMSACHCVRVCVFVFVLVCQFVLAVSWWPWGCTFVVTFLIKCDYCVAINQ
jgi:hypothetical protein